uniref:Disease resistance RPP13-like protein 1 n=1 Tax=Cajanus cajan TaxID=3821 RepID=A0A151S9U8_CAJCA|nr:Putative disease resistance RPP13-like protein 1 [Cajanus cajan]
MAVALVGGALLSAFLQVAFDRLASRQVLDFFLGRKLDETLVSNLNTMLRCINAYAEDAEQKQVRDSRVKAWLTDVKDVVLDAEDLLDEIDYELSKAESESQTCTCKVTVPFFNAALSSFNRKIESRMRQILEKLEYLAGLKGDLGLKESTDSGVGSVSEVLQRVPSTSLLGGSVLYGRNDDKEVIFNWLMSDIENGNHPSVFSIVGMGGMGKTTLMQHVYNDSKIEGKFDIKAWVYVSDDFDVLKVSRAILDTITKSVDDSRELEMVHGRLRDFLTGKRFLLVLDDVWNKKQKQWEALQTPLSYGAQGSKIVVTTRDMKVASTVRSNKIHLLRQLQDDHCWQLFAKHAFHDENPQSNSHCKAIGMKIVEKCKGLPLALSTIGGLLHKKSSILQWESVLTSEIWEFSEEDSEIIPALLLSYHHLPAQLKRCFAYCVLFPKGYEFDKEDLVLLWMAENFVQCSQQNMSMLEVGRQYFDDLLSRSFFQQSGGEQMYYVMHDLLNDLAKYVGGDFCFRTSSTFINDLFLKFKYLRVLSLSGNSSLTEVPDSIGNLKHLRSLDLSCTHIRKLPDSICSLYNLQILKLRYCAHFGGLPLNFNKLKLQLLDLSGTDVNKTAMTLVSRSR